MALLDKAGVLELAENDTGEAHSELNGGQLTWPPA